MSEERKASNIGFLQNPVSLDLCLPLLLLQRREKMSTVSTATSQAGSQFHGAAWCSLAVEAMGEERKLEKLKAHTGEMTSAAGSEMTALFAVIATC